LSDPVLIFDQKPVEDYRPLKKRHALPAPPLNVAVRLGPAACLASHAAMTSLPHHNDMAAIYLSIRTPHALQAAQAKLQESKDAKKRAKQEAGKADEDDLYVYLPPGSSMRDPVSLPNSMSDPLDNRRVRQG
jgi:hypothetical protein